MNKSALLVLSSFSLACAAAFAEPPSIVEVGTLDAAAPGSKAHGVSGDGLVVVGETNMPGGNTTHAFRWTSAGGMADLGTIGGAAGSSQAFGASKTGDVVVGNSPTPTSSGRGFRWTSATGPVDLGTIGGVAGTSTANAVSADGNVVTGQALSSNGLRVYRFADSTMSDLGAFGGNGFFVTGMSDDGSVIAGFDFSSFGIARAWRWTSGTGIQFLVPIPGDGTNGAFGISGDGTTIVGFTARSSGSNGMTWTEADGMQALEPLSAQISDASTDARIMVGHLGGTTEVAMVWIEGEAVSLATHLASLGVDLSEWSALKRATAVSSNGRVIVGNGTFIPLNCEMGFRAVLANEPPTVQAPQPVSVECTGDGTTVVLAAQVDDIDTETLRVSWRVNGVLQKSEDVPAGTAASFTFGFLDGESEVTIDVRDGDNIVLEETSVTVSDTTDPVVVIAPNATLRVDSGKTFASRSRLKPPSVTDVCDEDPTVKNNARARLPVGTTSVRWTATDADGNSASVTQKVKVFNDAPKAKAGRDVRVQTSSETAQVRLDGSKSSDRNDHRLSFSWSARGIPFVNGDKSKPTGTFPVGTTSVKLTVTDTLGAKSTDTVRVIVSRSSGRSAVELVESETAGALEAASRSSNVSAYAAAYDAYLLGLAASVSDDPIERLELRLAQSSASQAAGDELLNAYLNGGSDEALEAATRSYYGALYGLQDLAD